MDKELEQKLVDKYPKILKDYGGDPMYTSMCFGFQHENGWLELTEKCLQKLQYFCDICSKDGREVQVVATTIKEKLSSLGFYYYMEGANELESDIIDDIVSEAERRSEYTCEVSGESGVTCKKWGCWYKTLSYEQARKQGYVACNEETEKHWQEKDAKLAAGNKDGED